MSERGGAAAATSSEAIDADYDEAILDEALFEVAAHAVAWSRTSPKDRSILLARVVKDTYDVAEEWCGAACAAKGYDPESPEGAEELFSGVGTLLRMAQVFRQSMLDLDKGGRPRYPGPIRHKPGNRLAVRVVPSRHYDKVLFAGVTGEVWMEPGVDEDEVQSTQALAYQFPSEHVGVALVLGAGNVASIGPRDVLSLLFAEGQVVVLKANPVNDYLVPYWSRAMRALIEAGFLRVVSGGARVGAYLANHELITRVHVTGSDKTHDALVFGSGDEGTRRKAANEPLLTKTISCELGNVSPVVIVPGRWSDKEIAFQAAHVATMIVNNAGFNCLTPRVIVTHAQWGQREEFLRALEDVLSSLPTRRAYYPGAESRRAALVAAHPEARELGDVEEGTAPWTLIRDVDAAKEGDALFHVEAFGALCAETTLEADSPALFVRRATTFCNDVLWGTLSMTLIADPRTMEDRETGTAIDEAIATLRYGSIGVNLWPALSFALGTTVWGAYPGHEATDIQSGRGFVGNAYLFAHPQKSVVRGAFFTRPTPAWFATSHNSLAVMRRLLAFEAKPSWFKVPGLLRAALKG